MKKIVSLVCFSLALLIGGCGFLGDDNDGGDDRGSDPKNEGTDAKVILLEEGVRYA